MKNYRPFSHDFKKIPDSKTPRFHGSSEGYSNIFETSIFNHAVMKKMLPKEIYDNILKAEKSQEKINPLFADAIAHAMKEWAIHRGATHFTHWFQPLTGAGAEKHDAFLHLPPNGGGAVEQFSGKDLTQGEPDASSFPSGGLRSTFEARGYTGWDPSSPPFLWKGGDGLTLCIPSIYFSWTGDALDTKIPLLRSESKIQDAVLRLLKLTGMEASGVHSTIGLEQEYFLIPSSCAQERADLLLEEKTVFGAFPPKGQELQDHYLGSVKDKILYFMQELEVEALKLGIPIKTRHNEVAPSQYEIAPIYLKASKASDHNIMLMELMRTVAKRHNLTCLLHEKPFKGFNGSGKHCNWSLATDAGLNLLDPSETPGNNLHFIILLTAILHAIYTHASFLRASIGSYSNDSRLGGHEAPPPIMSVFLGKDLEAVLDHIEEKGRHSTVYSKEIFNLGLLHIPDLKKDHTDRNRTSPFAFTGSKFEFRAVGSSVNPAIPITVLNAIVASSLNEILDAIEKNRKSQGTLEEAIVPVIQRYIKLSKSVRFSGDNYSADWKKEAQKRGLPCIDNSLEAFHAFLLPTSAEAFSGILTEAEIKSRFDIAQEAYLNHLNIEINLMLDLFNSQILPAVLEHQKNFSTSIERAEILMKSTKAFTKQLKELNHLQGLIEKGIEAKDNLASAQVKDLKKISGKKALTYLRKMDSRMEILRDIVDELEQIVDHRLWPIPKYREILFSV